MEKLVNNFEYGVNESEENIMENNFTVIVDNVEMTKEEESLFGADKYLYDVEDRPLTEEEKYNLACGQVAMLAQGKFFTTEGGVSVKNKVTVKMFNILSNHTAGFKTEEGKEIKALLEQAIDLTTRKSYRNTLELEKKFKEMRVITTLAVKMVTTQDSETTTVKEGVDTPELIQKKKAGKKFKLTVELENKQESELVRGCEIGLRTVADGTQSQSGLFCSDIISFAIDDKNDVHNEKVVTRFCNDVDDRFAQDAEVESLKDGKFLFVIFHKSGFCEACDNLKDLAKMVKKGDQIYRYVFGLDTPSSKKKGAVTGFKIAEYSVDKKKQIKLVSANDIRFQTIDHSLCGGMSECFMNADGSWTVSLDKESLFKTSSTRIGLGAPASFELPIKITNCAVFKSIACNAGYSSIYPERVTMPDDPNFISCCDTKDGTSFTAMQYMQRCCKEMGLKIDMNTIKNICPQARGSIGAKQSTQTVDRAFIVCYMKALLARGGELLYIVVNGKQYFPDQITDELLEKLYRNIEGLFDKNGLKLAHDRELKVPEMTMTIMKKAHQSDSSLNMVVDIAMLIASSRETSKLLEERGRQHILDSLASLGVDITFDEDGNLDDVKIDYEKIKGVNAIGQDVDWLRNCCPEIMDAVNPGYIATKIDGIIKNISKMIEHLRVPAECKYSVVQADPAVIFGVRLLADNECFDPTCPEPKVSFIRHPMSGIHAVTTFKVVTMMEMISRISKLKGLSDHQREMLKEYYFSVSGYIVIPASHYLMEKHDGMDFDIDAGQEFRDQRVVSIFEKVMEIGTKIDRDADRKAHCSTEFSRDEIVIKNWADKRSEGEYIPLKKEYEEVTKTELRVNSHSEEARRGRISISGKFRKNQKKINFERESFDMDSNGAYLNNYHNNLMLFKEFQLNPVAQIGLIATGFYNNALLYSILVDKAVSYEDKTIISDYLNRFFGPAEDKEYVSPLHREEKRGKIEYTLDKASVMNVLFNYASCRGSVEDTTAFLFDCMMANRYIAESSIDAAKKKYKVIDAFNFCDIFKALGSDKNTHVRQMSEKENEAAFNEVSERLDPENNYGPQNYFSVKLLGVMYNECMDNQYDIDSVLCDVKGGSITDTTEPLETMEEYKVIGIKDELFKVRVRLTNFANDLLYLSAKELEAYVKSPEAQEIRDELRYLDATDDGIKIVSNTNRVGITINSSIDYNKDEIDSVAAKTYADNNLKTTLKNTAVLGFNSGESKYTKEEIGGTVMSYLIEYYKKGSGDVCRRSSNMVISVYLTEIVAYLKSLDIEGLNIDYGEKIQRISIDGKNQCFEDYEGERVFIKSGRGYTIDENDNDTDVLVSCKNKKADMEYGTIQKINGSYYVKSERNDSFDKNSDTGIYAAVMNNTYRRKAVTVFEKSVMNSPEKLSALKPDFLYSYDSVRFVRAMKYREDYLFNVIVVDIEGAAVPFCELSMSSTIADVLEGIELTAENFLFFCDGEYAAFHIKNDSLSSEIEDALIIEESFDESNAMNDSLDTDCENVSDDIFCSFLNGELDAEDRFGDDFIDSDITPVQ